MFIESNQKQNAFIMILSTGITKMQKVEYIAILFITTGKTFLRGEIIRIYLQWFDAKLAVIKNSEMGSNESVLKKYIDSRGRDDRDTLRVWLKNEPVGTRYELLMNVRGETFSAATGLHSAAIADDLDTVRCLLDKFLANQKYNVVKLQTSRRSAALHLAADRGYTLIINYLLKDLLNNKSMIYEKVFFHFQIFYNIVTL